MIDNQIQICYCIQLLGDFIELIEQVFFKLYFLHLRGIFPGYPLHQYIVLFQKLDGAILLNHFLVVLQNLQGLFPFFQVQQHSSQLVICQRQLVVTVCGHKELDCLIQMRSGTLWVLTLQQCAQVVGPAHLKFVLLFSSQAEGFIQEIIRALSVVSHNEVIGLVLTAFYDLVPSAQSLEKIETLHQVTIRVFKFVQFCEHRTQIAVKLCLDVFIAHSGQQLQSLEIEIVSQIQLIAFLIHFSQVVKRAQESFTKAVFLAKLDGFFIIADGSFPISLFEAEGAQVVQGRYGIAEEIEFNGSFKGFPQSVFSPLKIPMIHHCNADVIVYIRYIVGFRKQALNLESFLQVVQ